MLSYRGLNLKLKDQKASRKYQTTLSRHPNLSVHKLSICSTFANIARACKKVSQVYTWSQLYIWTFSRLELEILWMEVFVHVYSSLQIYKYREHIYFLQNKFKQSSPFRPLPGHDPAASNRPISASEACKLYGPNATQYINHSLASPMNPVSPGGHTADPKFTTRIEKKPFSGGRPWQV